MTVVTTAPIGDLVGRFIDRYRVIEGLHLMEVEDSGGKYRGLDSWSKDERGWLQLSVEELMKAREEQRVSDQDFYDLLHLAEADPNPQRHLHLNPSAMNWFDK